MYEWPKNNHILVVLKMYVSFDRSLSGDLKQYNLRISKYLLDNNC